MSPVAMRKLEIHVLKGDIDPVLSYLGEARCFQLIKPDRREEASWEPESARSSQGDLQPGSLEETRPKSYAREIEALRAVRDGLDLPLPKLIPEGTRLPVEADSEAILDLAARVAELNEAKRENEEKRNRTKDAFEESKAFSGLSLPFRDLDHLSFLALRIGHVDADALPSLSSSLGERAFVLPIDDKGLVVAAATKKGRFALDTELARVKFRPKEMPADFKGVPPEAKMALERELETLEAEAAALERRKAGLRESALPIWNALSASFAVAEAIEEVKANLDSSDFLYRLEGWVPRDAVTPITAELRRIAGDRIALRSFAPEEIPAVRSGAEEVPVLLKRRAFVSSFERLVVSYGAPLYGTVDPTPLVAFSFVLLFSIMFGDLGQGFVIMAVGLLLRSGRVLRRWKQFGPILIAVGIGSMVMGFLDGSFFAYEGLLVPLTRAISTAILGRPLDRFVTLMPTAGIGRLAAFFGFTLGVGVLVNSIGLVVNIVNKLRLGKLGEALFSKTGAAGALFFWWSLGLGVRVALGGGILWFDAIGIGLPLALVFLGEPLGRLVERKRGEGEGGFSTFVRGFVELIESVSYYVSNTLSFLRVGAFALSHAVLSFIVFTMGDLLRTRAPGGAVLQFLVLVAGNAIIIGLEGMIVAIQVVRLQYYEFFSKFFTETGKLFSPFHFEYGKE